MTDAASPPPAGTDAQPDREHSARWWNAMWAGSRSRYVEDLDDVRNQWELYEIRKYEYLRTLFPAAPGTLSLECGCGSAGVSLHLARRGYRAVMLDFAPSALGLARQNFSANGTTGVFVNGDVNGMPFADGQFDVVCSFGLIEHFVDVRPIIGEMVRVLRPGGLLFLDIVPARFNVQTIANIVFNWWVALGYGLLSGNPRLGVAKAAALFRPPYFENAFSMEQYAGWMAAAGCEQVFITGNNPFPRLYLPAAVDRSFLRWLIRRLPAWRRFDAMPDGAWKRHWSRAWWAHGYKRAHVRSKHSPMRSTGS